MPVCCAAGSDGAKCAVPVIMLVPRDATPRRPGQPAAGAPASRSTDDFVLLDDKYLKKHFGKELPTRALYLDSFRRPLVTFPVTQGEQNNFNMYRKSKINQGILDGTHDASMAIKAPSIVPYPRDHQNSNPSDPKGSESDEIIYVMQLPDCVCKCPVHSNQAVVMPRFVWYSSKRSKKSKKGPKDEDDECATDMGEKRGPGPQNRPKPWLLSRLTDFDLLSQW